MSQTSPILGLPFLQPSQAQKEVTVNESLSVLDVVVQLSLEDSALDAPPGSPTEGEVYGVGTAPTGAWSDQQRMLATWFNGAWMFIAPQLGWRAWDKAQSKLTVWDGNRWSTEAADGSEDTVTRLGISTSADMNNRLAVESPATLLTHAGDDHQLKVNKASDGDTASLLFQSNFTGHAEMGLAGSTDFSIKVSPDGSSWSDAIRFDATSGLASGAAVQDQPGDTGAGKLMTVGAFGLGADVADLELTDLDTLSVSGFWGQANPIRGTVARHYPQDDFQGTLLALSDTANGTGTQIATAGEDQQTYLRTVDGSDQWSNWRSVVLLGGEGGRSFSNRASLIAYIANPPVQHAHGDRFHDGRVDYVYYPNAEAIPDLPNLLPLDTVTPLHWGAVADGQADDGLAVEAAWLYWRTLESPARRQNPDSEQQDFYFPTGHYRAYDPIVLETDSVGSTIYGDGPISQLHGISIHLRRALEFELRDLRFRGAGEFGLKLSENARDGSVTGLFIRDRDVGILLDDATQTRFLNQEVFKCGIGLLVLKNSGCDFVNCQFTGARQFNVDVRAGGQLKMTNINCGAAGASAENPRGAANMRLYGNDARSVVENYFTKVSLSHAVRGARQAAILNVRDNGFGKARFTTLEPHELFVGFPDLRIKGTAFHEELDQDYRVTDVLSSTVFDSDMDFVADEEFENNEDGSQGTLWLKGWDLLVEAESAGRQVNDQFFTGGNINFTKIDAGFNLNFNGTRMKEQVWIGDTHDEINRIFFVRNGRGRVADTTSDTPVTGPGAARGWGEVGFFDDVPGWEPNGGEKISLRMPDPQAGVLPNSSPAVLNEMSLYGNQAKTSISGEEMIIDRSGKDGVLRLSMPANGVIDAANVPKAWGRITWVDGLPQLSEAYNIDSIRSESLSEAGRVVVLFDTPFQSADAVLPIATPFAPGDDGVTIQATLVEAGRIKFEGKKRDADSEVDFAFVIYGRLADS